ncbi:MAG: DedA family protein [Thermoguttaceae bacterium]
MLILTGAGLPLPEEVPIIAAAILAANGTLDPWLALACCLVGALLGDVVMYWVGYHFGRGVLRDHRWWVRCITPEREARVEQMFHQHGLKVFFAARFLVLLRSPLYLTAGILQVSFRKFVLIDLICASAVVSTFFGLTYFLGKNYAELFKMVEVWATIAAVIALAGVGIFLWRRHRRKAAKRDPMAAGPDHPVANCDQTEVQ